MRELDGGAILAGSQTPRTDWLKDEIHPDDYFSSVWVNFRTPFGRGACRPRHTAAGSPTAAGLDPFACGPPAGADGHIYEWSGAPADVTARRKRPGGTERAQRRPRAQGRSAASQLGICRKWNASASDRAASRILNQPAHGLPDQPRQSPETTPDDPRAASDPRQRHPGGRSAGRQLTHGCWPSPASRSSSRSRSAFHELVNSAWPTCSRARSARRSVFKPIIRSGRRSAGGQQSAGNGHPHLPLNARDAMPDGEP